MYSIKQAFLTAILIVHVFCLAAQESETYRGLTIRTGDLLFIGAQSENLSGAINRVTQRRDDISFDHVGIIELSNGKPYLIHASSKKGSVREPLDSIVTEKSEYRQLFTIYRPDALYQDSIPKAIQKAHALLGKPYNWSYKLNDNSYYCSDFVERAFRHMGFFTLEPMTFKNPKTGEFDPFWEAFYADLGMQIPEGELGCNPNGMASNSAIHRIGSFEVF